MSAIESLQRLQDQLDKDLSKVTFLDQLEHKTGFKRSTLMVVTGVLVFLAVLVGLLDNLLTNLVGFAYPAYASFKAIESSDPNDDTQWLTYWVVFAVFTLVEYFSRTLLYYFPLYYPTKLLFLLWCFLPQTQGAIWVYHNIVRTFLMANESRIDNTLQAAVDNIKDVVNGEAAKEITKKVQGILEQVASEAAKKDV